MDMKELDRQVLSKMGSYPCPECGKPLTPILHNGEPTGFDCYECQKCYSFDQIYCS